MPLRVYNTLSQSKEPFQTVVPGKVGMYVCGPTVYSKSHIGHMVGPVIFDTIKNYLVYLGFDVTWVVNITDVDDKLIVAAQNIGTTVSDAGRAGDQGTTLTASPPWVSMASTPCLEPPSISPRSSR